MQFLIFLLVYWFLREIQIIQDNTSHIILENWPHFQKLATYVANLAILINNIKKSKMSPRWHYSLYSLGSRTRTLLWDSELEVPLRTKTWHSTDYLSLKIKLEHYRRSELQLRFSMTFFLSLYSEPCMANVILRKNFFNYNIATVFSKLWRLGGNEKWINEVLSRISRKIDNESCRIFW